MLLSYGAEATQSISISDEQLFLIVLVWLASAFYQCGRSLQIPFVVSKVMLNIAIVRIIPHALSPAAVTVSQLRYISLSEGVLSMVMPLASPLLHKRPPRNRSSNVLHRSGSRVICRLLC